MENTSARTTHLSQFETPAPQQRIVLLGASNLSLMFPTIVETSRAMFAQPIEMFVAKGFGRSYGQQSKFFGKKFSGILQCGLWDEMQRVAALPTVAVIADVGNDLAYDASVETIVQWIETTLDRLAAYRAQVALNGPPIASLRKVGAVRYRVLREIFFPGCRIARSELLRRAEQLSEGLQRLAEERKTAIFSGESAAYRLDPIHPRRAAAGDVWQRMLGAVSPSSAAPPMVRAELLTAWRLNQLKPQKWSQFGWSRRANQPCARLADGTTIAIF